MPPSTRRSRARFLATYEAAAAGLLTHWEETPEGALALLIMLDQFPRNMFRNNARTFAADRWRARSPNAPSAAASIRGSNGRSVSSSICRSSIPKTSPTRSVRSRLVRAHGDADLLKWAELHADIIRRFGRFPHRNAMLGRATTPAEQAFLDAGGFAG